MSVIRILPDELSNLIAAGEVVERPASVVKELIENAIDAGATNIKVEISRAGSRLIAVSDNGSGMDEDDALLCLEPHGTSKIHTADDIERICTLGFRGEALPSIASVSKFSILTRKRENAEACEIEVHGGKLVNTRPAGGAPGTRMEVRDLFYNVPARKKFLRSAPTEEAHIQETFIMLALPYPQIGFELWFDGRAALVSPAGNDLRSRVRGIFGKTAAERYLQISFTEEMIQVNGLIAPPDWTRNSRREQRTFVNGRMIDSQAIYRGIREGYAERCESGRFAPTILFLHLPPEEFDINVHPTKREIRFRNENLVSRVVQRAISEALRQVPGPQLHWDDQIPMDALLDSAAIHYHVPEIQQPDLAGMAMLTDRGQAGLDAPSHLTGIVSDEDLPPLVPPPSAATPIAPEAPPLERFSPPESLEVVPEPPPEPQPESAGGEEFRLIGIFERCYLLIEEAGELLIVDQHAAHERVMYERLLDRGQRHAAIQQLLLPVTLELDRRTAQFLDRHRHCFAQLGFDLAELSHNTILVSGVPHDLPADLNVERLVLDIFDELLATGVSSGAVLPLDAVARAACHAAVKAHDVLDPREAVELLRSLRRCRRPDCCPHGRPTVIRLTLRELERRFGRS